MASLAGMLIEQGHKVTGSDENVYPPMSLELERLGVPVSEGYKRENVSKHADVVVVGNAITRGNPELEYVLDEKMYYTSMAAVVQENFIRGLNSIVVAGTHGKTTTTSLMAWALECAGARPSFLIGGVAENFDSSFRVTGGPYFVIEGDEYDTAYFDKGPKFMHYLPELAIVNNIEFDHADIYADLEAIKLAFRRFMNLVPSNGRLILGWDSPEVRNVVASFGKKLFTQIETFGTSPEARWQAREIVYAEGLTHFQIFREGESWAKFRTSLIGEFNVRNCLAAIIAADAWGVERAAIAAALASFKSVSRRCEIRGEVDGIIVIDDS